MKKVITLCNKILLKSNNETINFIDWLHYVKNHEYLNSRYSNKEFELFSIIKNTIIYLLINFKNLFIGCSEFKTIPKDLDFLVVSHKLSNSMGKDMYFGRLENFFKKKNINYDFLYLGHNKNIKNNKILNKATFYEKVKIFFDLISKFFCIILINKKQLNNCNFIFRLKIASEALSYKTFDNYVMHKNLKKILCKKKIKNLIITFEGFSYERAIFYTFKNLNLKTRLFGYQHASVIESQNGLFRDLNKKFNPDIILTSGSYTKKIFDNVYNNKEVIVFGSNKISVKKFKSKNLINNKVKKILALPEGIDSECEYMMNFVRKCVKELNDVEFIFRLHPLINFSYLKKKYKIFNDINKKIKFSNKTIDKDIYNSNYCLYRGTTSVINCVINNVYPIYLMKEKESTINILSNLKKLSKISKADELKKIIQNTNKNRINIKTKKFVKNYFTKVNFNVLLKFI